jgi:hypothetical protein
MGAGGMEFKVVSLDLSLKKDAKLYNSLLATGWVEANAPQKNLIIKGSKYTFQRPKMSRKEAKQLEKEAKRAAKGK